MDKNKTHTVHLWCEGLLTLYTVSPMLTDTVLIPVDLLLWTTKEYGVTQYCIMSYISLSVAELTGGAPSKPRH
jgi:hypothetical protein